MWRHLSEAADVRQFVDSIDTFFIDYDGFLGLSLNLELTPKLSL